MARRASVPTSLQRAAAEQLLVRVYRDEGWERREGYVVGIGSTWVLLSMVDDRARPDGFSAVLRNDITSVARAEGCERFVRRALELSSNWPPAPPPPGIDLDRTGGLIAGLSTAFPLITALIERADPDVCFIGRPQAVVDKTLFLREVTTNAEWAEPRRRDWRHLSFRDLTRIDGGGGYESALAAVAGEPPS